MMQVTKVWWNGDKLMAEPIDPAAIYKEPEQPAQQEPVAYLCENAVGHKYFRWKKPSGTYKPIALYTSPPTQRKPLTDKQILAEETLRYYFGQNGGAGPVSKQGRKVVDAIEAAHGIKET